MAAAVPTSFLISVSGVTPWLRGGDHAARAFLAAAVVGVAIVSTRVVNEGNGAASGRPDIDVLSADELLRAARQPLRATGRAPLLQA
jgi:hypothetical protein